MSVNEMTDEELGDDAPTHKFKLGKAPARRLHNVADLSVYVQGKLPPPPPKVTVPKVKRWGMFANDKYGDCTMAAVSHMIMAANVDVGTKDKVPTSHQTVEQYFELSGGQDTGLAEADVLNTWRGEGLFPIKNRISAFAPVDIANLELIHAAIAFYGGAYIGVQVPASAQEQFQNGEPWTIVPDSPIDGGHAIPLVAYDSQYVYAVTWGGIAPISYPWFAKYCDEAYAVLTQEFTEAGHDGLKVDLKALQADLNTI